MPDTSPHANDVLVVGAGPVGLTMASELTRHGVSCRIIDKVEGTTNESRALVVHARTMEAFDDMGIIDRALEQGRRVHGASIYARDERIIHVSLDDLDTPYPFFLDLNQSDTESILEDHLEELGRTVDWETEITELRPGDDGVSATIKDAGGSEQDFTYQYVVACDGAHSFCRKALDLDFPGGVYPREFLLADVHVNWAHTPDEWYAYLNERGLFFAAPLKEEGCWRIITERDAETEPAEVRETVETSTRENSHAQKSTHDESRRDEPTLEALRDALDTVAPLDIEVYDPVWMSYFRVHHRLLDRLREGRVLFAGDAAHLHSPLGGQGMNAGIQDAYNLAWKLGLVVRGGLRAQAHDRLLDSYHAERRAADKAVVEGTDRLFNAVLLRKPVSRRIRDRAASLLTSFEPIQQRLRRKMSMLTIDYRDSPIVDEDRAGVLQSRGFGGAVEGMRRWRDFGAGPHAGDRAPDARLSDKRRLHDVYRGTRHVLLLFTGFAGGQVHRGRLNTLINIGREVHAGYGAYVKVCLVVHSDEHPAGSEGPRPKRTGSGSVDTLLDPEGNAHHAYGARSNSLYLVRPDGYVGYRAQPARAEGVLDHLHRLLGDVRQVVL